jgi:hypothetical protein
MGWRAARSGPDFAAGRSGYRGCLSPDFPAAGSIGFEMSMTMPDHAPQPSALLNLPGKRSERWPLLASLIAEWYRPLAPGDGYGGEELRQSAERLGITIPTAMREWYGLAGRRDDVWSQQDTLLSPKKLFCEDGVLHFFIENQAVTCWGLRTGDLSRDDPPVVVRDEHQTWVVQSPTLSEFTLHLFTYAVQFGRQLAYIHGFAHPPCVERIVRTLPKLGFPGFVWGRVRLFGFRDLIVSIDGTQHISASGQTEQALAPFRQLIDGHDFEIISETNGSGT